MLKHAPAWLGLASLFIAGCQTYDFEPVIPGAIAQTTQPRVITARQLKPNLMLLVDKSGSMELPTNTNNPACPQGCGSGGTKCPANCPTRWSELKDAMNTFLTESGAVARMGMMAYPAVDNECGAPSQVSVAISTSEDVAAELSAHAAQINAQIQTITPGGGTPTGASLQVLGEYQPLLTDQNREDFVLVLTDGLPNCNDQNVNSCTTPAACRCTIQSCGTSEQTDRYCRLGCLDEGNVVARVAELNRKRVRTIVVGFGADTASGDGPVVLNKMAEAGGFARVCPNKTNAECGSNNTCDIATGVCAKRYYQAADGRELSEALRQIAGDIGIQKACEHPLEAVPGDPRFLSVIVDGVSIQPGPTTWTYSAGKVTFVESGELCRRARESTSANPLKVEFRIVEGL